MVGDDKQNGQKKSHQDCAASLLMSPGLISAYAKIKIHFQ